MRHINVAAVLLLWTATASAGLANNCNPLDFLNTPISHLSSDAVVNSILNGYPDITFDSSTNEFVNEYGGRTQYEKSTNRSPKDLLTDGTIGDQFHYNYTLSFDLNQRQIPWWDPGRIRNDAFFKFLYGNTENEVRDNLTRVRTKTGNASFYVTQRHGVDCQLSAALEQLGAEYKDIFSNTGGSFNWRYISGTTRLSAHSFGAAIDVNTSMGGYWIWSGQKEGAVEDYVNQIPEKVVTTLEKFGFIWGGKWHHFDGMHFEYRPEMVIFSRLNGSG